MPWQPHSTTARAGSDASRPTSCGGRWHRGRSVSRLIVAYGQAGHRGRSPPPRDLCSRHALWASRSTRRQKVPGGFCADCQGVGGTSGQGIIGRSSAARSAFCCLASSGTAGAPRTWRGRHPALLADADYVFSGDDRARARVFADINNSRRRGGEPYGSRRVPPTPDAGARNRARPPTQDWPSICARARPATPRR